jgi:cation diffusion facilitator family transporter
MAGRSRIAVVSAASIGVGLALAEFLVAGLGGSSIMLSEGIHSGIAAANDGLLLIGMKKSKRPPDSQHPFGYSQELYIWSMIVAISILGLGGGISFSEGVRHILKPQPVEKAGLAYIALSCALLFDGVTLGIAYKQFRKMTEGKPFWNAVNTSKDPNPLIVLGENAAAIIGGLVAIVGIWLNRSGMLIADGIGSIIIGLLLTANALFLIQQIRHLLIGEAVEKNLEHSIREIAQQQQAVVSVQNSATLQLGPEDVLLTMNVSFDEGRSASEIVNALGCIQKGVASRFPSIKHIYIQPKRNAGASG